jgi:hypothetical protein
MMLSQTAAPDTNEYKSKQIAPNTTTLTAIKCVSVNNLGSSNTYTLTLRVNGSDSTLTLTIGANTKSGQASGSVSITAGDILSMKIVQSGTGVAAFWEMAAEVY